MTAIYVNEFDRRACSVRRMLLEEAMMHYDDEVLVMMQQDGSAFVNNEIEIYLDGCYTPTIVLTLEK